MVWGTVNRDEQIKSQINGLIKQLEQNTIESMFLLQSFLPISPESAISIGDALLKNKSLEELYLSGHDLGLDGSKSIGNALAQHTAATGVGSLNSLDLCQNDIDDAALPILAKILIKSTGVRVLNLAYNTFTPSGFAAFIDTLISYQVRLEKLQFTGNNIGDDGAVQLARMIAQNHGLNNIEVNDCQIGEVGARALGSALVVWNGDHFAASDNPRFSKAFSEGFMLADFIGEHEHANPDGAALATANNGSQLRSLVLRGCHIGDEGISLIVEAIMSGRLPSLNLLDVAVNSLTIRSLEMLAGILTVANGAKLKILDVSCNELGSEAVEIIANCLQSGKLTTLTCLSINNINIGLTQLKQLCKYLIQFPNSSLHVIETMGNNGDDKDKEKEQQNNKNNNNNNNNNTPDQHEDEEEEEGQAIVDDEFLDLLDQLYEDTEIDLKWK
ncbi:leucine-rich repeat-containing protein [Heterostelium album PN500]|uniref:Leucine-rich repeat-containing protein n=1 Tax=Heterostelium pallidum (strain ATCC 26659 / Pp 5 / PN500) TaxID=670386 RepID=D3BFK5_HETP5|nr:leucine-rich repeat-containing protein [Heterostelium album PN500]EFA79919.1 leucine-rich repeat-containing protein [Heterostelium album PN500]|eukprot:XP_020432039.1 leucine-rich repeat-containing protein [Heterostelium album PN500]